MKVELSAYESVCQEFSELTVITLEALTATVE